MMKNLLWLGIIFLICSCSSTRFIDLGNKVAADGITVSQKAVEIYSTLSQQAGIEKLQEDKLYILTDPYPESLSLPDSKLQDFSKQIEPRIKAYQSLLNIYKSFSLLADTHWGDKTQETISGLTDSYNTLSSLPDLPASVSSYLPELSKQLSEAVQAKKIKNYQLILSNLTGLYLNYWKNDEPVWNVMIDTLYDKYAQGMNSVSPRKYDVKKISQSLKEPYKDDETLILLYKLNQRNEIYSQRDAVKKQLCNFENILTALNLAHSELAKKKPNFAFALLEINSLETLLK